MSVLTEARLEEHFVVKVQDEALQKALTDILHVDDESSVPLVELNFESERVGKLTITVSEEVKHCFAVTLHELPTIVETYKTHNHVNLVKLADVGQVLYVHPLPAEDTLESYMVMLQEQETLGGLPLEADDGVTIPMQNARGRVFRKTFKPDAALVQAVEEQLVCILNGEAPPGWRFEDVEETFVVDKKTGKGAWKPSSAVCSAEGRKKKKPGQGDDAVVTSAVLAADDAMGIDEDAFGSDGDI